jgi:Amt family ammonium transporter
LLGCWGALAAMFLTWAVYKKPDISMTLNGVLAGLVGVTAGCAAVSPVGAFFLSDLSVVAVAILHHCDKKLKLTILLNISVHGACGALGTFISRCFAIDGGLLYGGGFEKNRVQAIGVFSIAAWAGALLVVLSS